MPVEKRKPSDGLRSRLLFSCCRILPSRLRKCLFVSAALAYFHLFPRHRLITLYNLRASFPEKEDAEIRAIAKGVFRHIAIVGAELFDLPGLSRENIHNMVTMEGLDNLRRALEKGRGVIFVSAHFGNWELSAVAMSLVVKPLAVIYRPLDNSLLDDMIFAIRSATGNTPLAKEGAMRQMLRHLQRNSILGILVDQNVARREGVFVEYFSRPACTSDGVAQLAMRTKAAVLPTFCVRKADGTYLFRVEEEMPTVDTGDWDADVIVNTQNYTKIIEDRVREHPDQWLWVHNRWKTKPWQTN